MPLCTQELCIRVASNTSRENATVKGLWSLRSIGTADQKAGARALLVFIEERVILLHTLDL